MNLPDKPRLVVLCGGRSSEHEVSVLSARSMLAAIDQSRYALTVVGITRSGRWLSCSDPQALLAADSIDDAPNSAIVPVTMDRDASSNQLSLLTVGKAPREAGIVGDGIDVVFPLLHGPYGEDGTVQGLLEMADVAYVGSGVLGSALGMDKEFAKKLFSVAGLQQLAYTTIRRYDWEADPQSVLDRLQQSNPWPVFVKPANAGSSVGVSKVRSRAELAAALDLAAQFDTKMIVEEDAGDCHEVECAVLGNDKPRASVVGEILAGNEFYDYADKYVNGASEVVIPAPISTQAAETVREQALVAFAAVEAAGLARVDFFVRRQTDEVFINEINTMPGFTPISMYPKLWQASGLDYAALIDELVQLALERHAVRRSIRLTL